MFPIQVASICKAPGGLPWSTYAWKTFECPRCKAAPGESCRTPKGRSTDTHGVRTDVAFAAAKEG